MKTTCSTRFGLAIACVLLATGGAARAGIIYPGYDLFITEPETSFAGVQFVGAPLVSFDFGPPHGIRSVGNVDTIVHRLAPASVPGTSGTAPPVPIELVTLNLRSASQVDMGAGLGYYYIGLQSERGGPASIGQMSVTFASDSGGTFDSFFDVFFDIRFGTPDGAIVFSTDMVLSSSGSHWGRSAPAGAVVIDGIDHMLNGADTAADFWPIGPDGTGSHAVIERHPSGSQHVVGSPAPGTVSLLAMGSLLACRRRRG